MTSIYNYVILSSNAHHYNDPYTRTSGLTLADKLRQPSLTLINAFFYDLKRQRGVKRNLVKR